MREFTMGSLFAGIGGFDLGFERAGFRTSWQVEIDPFAQKVLAKNFPHAQRFGDIRTVGAHNLEPVDVICGGFPCQDISNAGKRAGITGARSGLVTEGIRVIRELRPRFVLLENVAALLARGLGEVLGFLAEIGYDAEWEVVSAADAGFPHLRERVWVLAYPDSYRPQIRINVDGIGSQAAGCEQPRGALDGVHTPAVSTHSERGDFARGGISERVGRIRQCLSRHRGWEASTEPFLGRGADGIPARLDRLRCLGNAVVPQIPELFARRIRAVLESDYAR